MRPTSWAAWEGMGGVPPTPKPLTLLSPPRSPGAGHMRWQPQGPLHQAQVETALQRLTLAANP